MSPVSAAIPHATASTPRARRTALIYDGVVASYIRDISTRTAPAKPDEPIERLARPRASRARKLTNNLTPATKPDFAPDGRTICFQGYVGNSFHVWSVHPDGTGLRRLTSGP